ncbi:MAG TPA: VOC family protein [Woeseiaceae bacterium]|jgi:catechol 2,3-dioxygenase-like lactoylglutathione lyase family enzyme|nr:VOC family protein [Woeseiaceae bacterium]
MRIEVSAVDHIYVTVADLERSVAFYDPVMKLLGFRKSTRPIGGEPHVHYFNPVTQYTLRPSHGAGAAHDPYRPGLHHVCFRLDGRDEVDAAAHGLQRLGIDISEPKLYPEYAPDYYATFFTDPDGIHLELVALRQLRKLIREHWHELTEFENPLTKAGLLP